jgi:hypothetical protein
VKCQLRHAFIYKFMTVLTFLKFVNVLQRRYAELIGLEKFLLIPCEEIFELARFMLYEDPEKRARTEKLVGALGTPLCCCRLPEPYFTDGDLGQV